MHWLSWVAVGGNGFVPKQLDFIGKCRVSASVHNLEHEAQLLVEPAGGHIDVLRFDFNLLALLCACPAITACTSAVPTPLVTSNTLVNWNAMGNAA
jgi:hypothetical protein